MSESQLDVPEEVRPVGTDPGGRLLPLDVPGTGKVEAVETVPGSTVLPAGGEMDVVPWEFEAVTRTGDAVLPCELVTEVVSCEFESGTVTVEMAMTVAEVYVTMPSPSGSDTDTVEIGVVTAEVLVTIPSPYGLVLDVVCLLNSARTTAATGTGVSCDGVVEVSRLLMGEEFCWLASRSRIWLDATPARRSFLKNICDYSQCCHESLLTVDNI